MINFLKTTTKEKRNNTSSKSLKMFYTSNISNTLLTLTKKYIVKHWLLNKEYSCHSHMYWCTWECSQDLGQHSKLCIWSYTYCTDVFDRVLEMLSLAKVQVWWSHSWPSSSEQCFRRSWKLVKAKTFSNFKKAKLEYLLGLTCWVPVKPEVSCPLK